MTKIKPFGILLPIDLLKNQKRPYNNKILYPFLMYVYVGRIEQQRVTLMNCLNCKKNKYFALLHPFVVGKYYIFMLQGK